MDSDKEGSPEPYGGAALGTIRQLHISSNKSITPHLTLPYVRAQRILHLARNVDAFHTQSVVIARQALRLVVLLNDRSVEGKGPDKQERDERAILQRELTELETAIRYWGVPLQDPSSYAQHTAAIKFQYDRFFRQRFYYRANDRAEMNDIYQKLSDYDQINMALIQRQHSSNEDRMDIDDMPI